MPVSIHFSRLKAYMPQSKEVIKMLIADNKVSNRDLRRDAGNPVRSRRGSEYAALSEYPCRILCRQPLL